MSIIFFYFIKIIFEISISKYINLKQKNFKFFKNTFQMHCQTPYENKWY